MKRILATALLPCSYSLLTLMLSTTTAHAQLLVTTCGLVCPASATATPAQGTVPLSVVFSASPPSGPTPTGLYWNFDHWDFGDGQTSAVLPASHTYTMPGQYTAAATFLETGCSPYCVVGGDVETFGSTQASVVVTVTPPTSLSLTPATLSLMVGDSRTLKLADQNGSAVTGANWTIDNTAVLSLSTDDPPVITALNPGTAKVTAALGSLSAQTTINVYLPGSNGGFPPGTVKWSVAPASGFTPSAMLQAVPTAGNTPDLIAIESNNSFPRISIIRGLTADGQQIWQAPLTQYVTPTDPNLNYVLCCVTIPDSLGGTVSISTALVDNTPYSSLTSVNGQTGLMGWQYVSPGAIYPGVLDTHFANSADATFVVETLADGPGTVFGDAMPASRHSYLVGFDSATGNIVERLLLPTGHYHDEYGGPNRINDYDNGATPGFVTIAPDGSVNVQVETSQFNAQATTTLTHTFYAITLHPDGTSTTVQLQQDSGQCPGECQPQILDYSAIKAIPDTQQGLLIAWHKFEPPDLYSFHVTHMDSTGALFDYTLPLPTGVCDFGPDCGELVIGENNTAFATNSGGVVAFDVNSGVVQYAPWQPVQGHTTALVMAATDDNLVAKDVDQNGNESIVNFDASGNPSYDLSLGANAVGLDYWTLGDYISADSVGLAFKKIAGASKPQPAMTSAPHPHGGSRHKNGSPRLPEFTHFLPFHIESLGEPNPYDMYKFKSDMLKSLPNTDAAHTFRLREFAVEGEFMRDLETPVDAFAFIGHASNMNITEPDKEYAIGLFFYYPLDGPLNLNLEPDFEDSKMLPLDKDSTTVVGLGPAWSYIPDPEAVLVDKIETSASVLFFASCALKPTFWHNGEIAPFLQMWNLNPTPLHPTPKAIIVSDTREVHLALAAKVWKIIARKLADGEDVGTAVDEANTDPILQGYLEQWEVVGDRNLRIAPPKKP